MWELSARTLACGALVALAGWTGVPPFEVAWKIAALTAAYAFLLSVIDRRKLMNPGMAGLGAGLDALAIGAAVGYAGASGTMGFLVLAPIVYAVVRRGSNPLATGSIGAAALLFGHTMAAGVNQPEPGVLLQTLGVLAVSLVCNHPRVVVRPKTIKEMIAELGVTPEDTATDTGAQAMIELREKYRRLTASYRELERRTRSDRISARLLLAKHEPSDIDSIIETLREALDANGAVLYLANRVGDRMVVTAEAGAVPKDSPELSFPLNPNDAAHHLRDRAQEALLALRKPEDVDKPLLSCNVVLKLRGRVAGMLTLIYDDAKRLDEGRELAEEVSGAMTQIVLMDRKARNLARRLSEAELLYEIACRLDGAATEMDLGRRTARALSEVVTCDHVGVWLLDGLRPVLVGRAGKISRLFDHLRYDQIGLEGWIEAGSPPVEAFQTAEHDLIDRPAASKERIGSYILVPILHGADCVGFISLGAAASGKLGHEDALTLRDTAAEFGHTLALLRNRSDQSYGLVSLAELQRDIVEHPAEQTTIVYVEPLHFEDMQKQLGRPAIEMAARRLGLMIRRNTPPNGRVCRKADGSYVVLLPDTDLEAAQAWANAIVAEVSMRTFESVGAEGLIPLAVRARAADLNARFEAVADTEPQAPEALPIRER